MCGNCHNCLLGSTHAIILTINHDFSCDKFVTPRCKRLIICLQHSLPKQFYLTIELISKVLTLMLKQLKHGVTLMLKQLKHRHTGNNNTKQFLSLFPIE